MDQHHGSAGIAAGHVGLAWGMAAHTWGWPLTRGGGGNHGRMAIPKLGVAARTWGLGVAVPKLGTAAHTWEWSPKRGDGGGGSAHVGPHEPRRAL